MLQGMKGQERNGARGPGIWGRWWEQAQNDGGLAEISSYGALQVIMESHMVLLIGSNLGNKCLHGACVHRCRCVCICVCVCTYRPEFGIMHFFSPQSLFALFFLRLGLLWSLRLTDSARLSDQKVSGILLCLLAQVFKWVLRGGPELKS